MVERTPSLRNTVPARSRVILILVAIVAILVVGSGWTHFRALAEAWKIIPIQEAFTELYFVQQPITSTSSEGVVVMRYSFEIHSQEVQDREYTLVAYRTREGVREEIKRWGTTIRPDERYRVEDTISVDDTASGTQLDIEIDQSDQRIYIRFP